MLFALAHGTHSSVSLHKLSFSKDSKFNFDEGLESVFHILIHQNFLELILQISRFTRTDCCAV